LLEMLKMSAGEINGNYFWQRYKIKKLQCELELLLY